MNIEFSENELETLISALVRTKFGDADPPEPYFGSPFLSSVHNRLLDALVAESERTGDLGRSERWKAWRRWAGREYEREIVVRHSASLDLWGEWDSGQKLEYLRIVCSPFSLSPDELEELCREIDLVRSSAN